MTTATTRPLDPCTDPRCPVHARGADLARAKTRTCARQILRAHDRDDAIVLLEQEPPPCCEVGASRALLTLRCPLLAAGQSERIFAEPAPSGETRSARRIHSFRPERVLLKTDGATQPRSSWRVDDILVDGQSQLGVHGKLPAELFGSHVAGAGIRVFDRATDPIRVEVEVTRLTGEGQDILVGAVLGSATYEPRAIELRSEARVRGEQVVRVGRLCEQAVEIHQLVIQDHAGDWIVRDILIDGISQFSQPGDIPGEMFAEDAVDVFTQFGTVAPGERVELLVVYIGPEPEGRVLSATFRGQEPESLLVPLRGDELVPRGQTVKIDCVQGEPVRDCRLTIEDADDWIVRDVRADDTSLLRQKGDLPGILFAESATGDHPTLRPIAAGSRVQIIVTYTGTDPGGRAFSARIRGLTPRPSTQRDR